MKKLLLFNVWCSLIIDYFASAQSPEWLWAKRAGGINNDFNWSCTTDANGNIITNGRFYSPTLTLGTITLSNTDPSGITSDIFIVKYDPNGNVLWARNPEGITNDEGWGCSIDNSGNIIAIGFFRSPALTLGTITLNNADTSGITSDIFIVKYDPDGNVLWVKSEGGIGNDESVGVSNDASGNIIATGIFKSSNITFGTNTLVNAGGADIFIVKYDPDGNIIWAKGAGGSYDDTGISAATDNEGNLIVTGGFGSSSITFGSTILTNINIYSLNMFIVKYNGNGNVLWAKSTGGIDMDAGYSCTTDTNGNIVITGFFDSSSITFGTTTLVNTGGVDMFIVKYDSNGNVLWAKKAGGTSDDFGINCTTNSNGDIIATGVFKSSSITFGTTTLNNSGFGDFFIVKYNPLGNILWAKSAGGSSDDFGVSCVTDINENIIITGYFESPTLTFGTTTLTNTDTSGETCDIFLLKLNNNIVGISEKKSFNEIILFPNPCEGMIQFVINNHFITIIEIYNVIGKKIFQSSINNQLSSVDIDLSNETNGIYFLSAKTDEGIIFKKIVVNK